MTASILKQSSGTPRYDEALGPQLRVADEQRDAQALVVGPPAYLMQPAESKDRSRCQESGRQTIASGAARGVKSLPVPHSGLAKFARQ